MNWDLSSADCAALKERLARSIDSSAGPDECWPWTGSLNRPNGYGATAIRVGGRNIGVNASRAVFIAEHGRLSSDQFVLHSCDYPACCNPRHLRAGSHQENMDDRKQRGKYYRGADNYRALQISDELVAEIRARYAPRKPGCSQLALAAQYGLSRGAIQAIVTRRGRWADPSEAARITRKLSVTGHELWEEGHVQTDSDGYVVCRCGARGPKGAGRFIATRWHQQHKADLVTEDAA